MLVLNFLTIFAEKKGLHVQLPEENPIYLRC